jgi:DNA repair protein RecN (Recombination protein N)
MVPAIPQLRYNAGMLAHIQINNYTIVDELDMELAPGMTVITGETGAGKSIMLDALGLCLGDRADPAAVRAGCERAEVTATFDVSGIPAARRWLDDRELAAGDECILRRVITREGRSRAFINGNASTLQDCSQLGALLIDVHSQHAHQSLLRKDTQRHLLDDYAGQGGAARELEQLASDWLRRRRELDELTAARDEQSARSQLLSYQVEELDSLALKDGELEALEAEHKQLANAEQILQAAQQAMDLCEHQESGTRSALALVQHDAMQGDAVNSVREMLDSAAIQLQEAQSELRRYLDQVELDPGRLKDVENRLDTLHDVARKHRVQARDLAALHAELREELDSLTGSGERIEELAGELAAVEQAYRDAAEKLSKARSKAADKLKKLVEKQLAELAMEQCRFQVALSAREVDNPHPHGMEDVEFLISTNPGQEPRSLGKIASGGELSRISLAIQVISASANTVPSMVFDEVDVGIGGAVAEVVGRLLRAMATASQVICVTHLPQVAAQGQQHLRVSKSADKKAARADLARLDESDKVEEIARMLGGIDITEKTRDAAREMLSIKPLEV